MTTTLTSSAKPKSVKGWAIVRDNEIICFDATKRGAWMKANFIETRYMLVVSRKLPKIKGFRCIEVEIRPLSPSKKR